MEGLHVKHAEMLFTVLKHIVGRFCNQPEAAGGSMQHLLGPCQLALCTATPLALLPTLVQGIILYYPIPRF
jgi:hypothetical protein